MQNMCFFVTQLGDATNNEVVLSVFDVRNAYHVVTLFR